MPWLAILTVLIWTTEALRLFFVVQALGFTDLYLGISGAFFVALVASLLTAVPVHARRPGHRRGRHRRHPDRHLRGADPTEATAIALVDRAISVLSVIILGCIAYVLSRKTKGIRGAARRRGAVGGLSAPDVDARSDRHRG